MNTTELSPLEAPVRRIEPPLSSALHRACLAARTAADNKARDIIVLDMRPCTPLFDYFVIATGASRRQIHTLAEEIDDALQAEGDSRMGIEGYEASKWVVQDYGDVVVHASIGPGPNAQHGRFRFTPDHAWQCGRLDSHFADSTGVNVYVGEWHTHPQGSAAMSLLDRRTLRRIARHAQASCPRPLMLIGAGAPIGWRWQVHQYAGPALFGIGSVSTERLMKTFAA